MIDLAGFTALTEAHGDHRAADLAVSFEELSRSRLAEDDRLIKSIGDAVLLASRTSTSALSLVRTILDGCNELPDFPIARAGLHRGNAVERGADMYGTAVNLTARVAGQASGGQVLTTAEVAAAARTGGFNVRSIGTILLRNIREPRELFEVGLSASPELAGIDPVCRMKVNREDAAGTLWHGDAEYWFCSLACAGTFAAAPARHAH